MTSEPFTPPRVTPPDGSEGLALRSDLTRYGDAVETWSVETAEWLDGVNGLDAPDGLVWWRHAAPPTVEDAAERLRSALGHLDTASLDGPAALSVRTALLAVAHTAQSLLSAVESREAA